MGQFPKGLGSDQCENYFFFFAFLRHVPCVERLATNQMGNILTGLVEKLDGLTNTWRLESRAWQEFSIGKVQFGGRTKLHEVPFAIGYIVRSCDTVYARARTRDCNGRVMLMNES